MEVPAEDIVGHYEEEFKPLMQDNFIQETDKEVEESEIPQSYIKHFVNPKGREYILSFHKTLVSYNKGKERWIVSSALDITELLAAKEKAEEANRLKSAFLLHTFRLYTRRRYKGIHTYHRRKHPTAAATD